MPDDPQIPSLAPQRERPPDWHRGAVGGLWEEIGRLQYDFLVRQGLRPEHYLLDVGCGSLRGGVHFIAYLEPGHYYGVDKNKELLDAGRLIELPRYGLVKRAPILVDLEDFDFAALGREFDYALAHSLFTHLPLNSIIRCVMNLERVLVPGGRFYTTFFENPKGKSHLGPILHPRVDGPDLATYFDRDPYHYDVDTFQWVSSSSSLHMDYIGEWGHPRSQRMLVFTKT
jgi:SAM-dependent methyltransferase